MLLGFLAVNAWVNVIYLVVGALGIASYVKGWYRPYCLGIGIFFLLVGLMGLIPAFVAEGGLLLGFFHVNGASSVLHLLVGAIGALAFFAPQLGGRGRGTAAPSH
jgi:hypothetical protein